MALESPIVIDTQDPTIPDVISGLTEEQRISFARFVAQRAERAREAGEREVITLTRSRLEALSAELAITTTLAEDNRVFQEHGERYMQNRLNTLFDTTLTQPLTHQDMMEYITDLVPEGHEILNEEDREGLNIAAQGFIEIMFRDIEGLHEIPKNNLQLGLHFALINRMTQTYVRENEDGTLEIVDNEPEGEEGFIHIHSYLRSIRDDSGKTEALHQAIYSVFLEGEGSELHQAFQQLNLTQGEENTLDGGIASVLMMNPRLSFEMFRQLMSGQLQAADIPEHILSHQENPEDRRMDPQDMQAIADAITLSPEDIERVARETDRTPEDVREDLMGGLLAGFLNGLLRFIAEILEKFNFTELAAMIRERLPGGGREDGDTPGGPETAPEYTDFNLDSLIPEALRSDVSYSGFEDGETEEFFVIMGNPQSPERNTILETLANRNYREIAEEASLDDKFRAIFRPDSDNATGFNTYVTRANDGAGINRNDNEALVDYIISVLEASSTPQTPTPQE